jgi:O-antigen/teichoic acid export membrane protein
VSGGARRDGRRAAERAPRRRLTGHGPGQPARPQRRHRLLRTLTGTPSNDEGRSLASNALLLVGALVAGNVGYFAAVLLLARALGPSQRGTTAFITVTAMVTARCANLGLNEATRVFAAQRPGARPALLANLILASVVLSTAGAALVCGALLALPSVRPGGIGRQELVILAAATVATGVGSAGYSYLQGCSRFRAYGLVQSTASWFYAMLLALAWVVGGLTAARAAVAWTVAQALQGVVLLGAGLPGIGLGRPSPHLLRESLAFGARAWVGGLSQFLNARTDQILTALIASEATLGIYAVAVNASEILFYLPAAVAAALLPVVARDGLGGGPERTLSVFRPVALVTLGGIVVAAVLGPVLIPPVFGEDNYQGAVAPFLWLLPSAIGFAASTTFSAALVASGSPGLSSLGPAVALALGIALDLVLIPAHGASGAAAAASAALLAGGAVAAAAYRSRTGFGWGELVPRPRDVRTLAQLARRALRPRTPAGS